MGVRQEPRPCACGCGETTRGGRWVRGHDWHSPAQRRAAAEARRLAAEAPPSRWNDPLYTPGPEPEVLAARSLLESMREDGGW